MPGVERLPLWLRLALYWILFTIGIAAIGAAFRSEPLTIGSVISTGVLVLVVAVVFMAAGGLRRRYFGD